MKQKQLHSHGKGNKPLTADKLSENDFIIFNGKEILNHLHQDHLEIQCKRFAQMILE